MSKKIWTPLNGKFSFSSRKGKTFRWVFLLSLFSLLAFALILFLESVIEPRLGVHLTGEPAAPLVLEKMNVSEQRNFTRDVPSSSSFFAAEEKEEHAPTSASAVETSELRGLQEQLKYLENHVLVWMAQEEAARKVGTAFILLRQDILFGVPFVQSLQRFETLLSPQGPLKESFQALSAFAAQGVWPLEKVIHQFSTSYVVQALEEKPGFWKNISAFIKSLWTVRRTDAEDASPLDQGLQEAVTALHRGNVEAALLKLKAFSRAETSAAQEWFQQAQHVAIAQKALRHFEQGFFQSSSLSVDLPR